MTLLDEILAHNQAFVANKEYEQYQTSKYPNKKLVVLSCMDTRLTQLLPSALNIHQGDAKFVQNAGGIVSHPYGSIMRSILVAVYTLHAEEVMVVGHHDCGVANIQYETIEHEMLNRGVEKKIIDTLQYSNIDLNAWFTGFSCVEDSVKNSVEMIKAHPLMPKDIVVHGLVIDPSTGKADVVVNGYKYACGSE